METNVLCEREEQRVLSELYEELSFLLQDSDDKAEKDRVRDNLKKMNDTSAYMVLGEEGVGKTSLLHLVFHDILPAQCDMSGSVCEYRWGETDYELPVTDGICRKFIPSDNMRGISIIDTKGINRMGKDMLEKIWEMAAACCAIFVAFDAGNVKSPRLWDTIESFPKKKMVFFLTKCDTVSPDALKENLSKLQKYMQESNIDAPVFPVCITDNCADQNLSEPDTVRRYIRNQVVGRNPMLRKQQENIKEMQAMLSQFQESFHLRKRQYESDAAILERINASLDHYVLHHKEIVMKLTKNLEAEISSDIDNYEREIISKMDPYKIKERFKTKEDFIDYLNMVNDNYKAMMSESVNRKTIEVMKGCMHDLEAIFQEATGYFNERENILALNDHFYGSLSQSRRQIVAETRETSLTAGQFYQTLSDASMELFLGIWKEREKYDKKIAMRETLSIITGGGTGTATGVTGGIAVGKAVKDTLIAAKAVSEVACGKALVAGILTGSAFVLIGVIVEIAIISYIAKKIFDPMAAEKMEKNVQECIEMFHEEVCKTREIMIGQVTKQITDLFENELANIDNCFTDFRISVNVEAERIPVLEEKVRTANTLMSQIRELEGSKG